MSRPGSLLKLEEDAYYAVLRALAVNDLDWVIQRSLSITLAAEKLKSSKF